MADQNPGVVGSNATKIKKLLFIPCGPHFRSTAMLHRKEMVLPQHLNKHCRVNSLILFVSASIFVSRRTGCSHATLVMRNESLIKTILYVNIYTRRQNSDILSGRHTAHYTEVQYMEHLLRQKMN